MAEVEPILIGDVVGRIPFDFAQMSDSDWATVFRVGLPLLPRDGVLRQRRPTGGPGGVRGGDSIDALRAVFARGVSKQVNKSSFVVLFSFSSILEKSCPVNKKCS